MTDEMWNQIVLSPVVLGLLLLFAMVWTVLDVRRELQAVVRERHLSDDPELSAGANLWIDRAVETFGVLVGIILGAPAILAAIEVVRRAW